MSANNIKNGFYNAGSIPEVSGLEKSGVCAVVLAHCMETFWSGS
jgi:hypothetical protein